MSDSFATPWTVAHQIPLPMGFPKQEYWTGLPVSFSRGSSWPRDQTDISCIEGVFFTTEPLGSPSTIEVFSEEIACIEIQRWQELRYYPVLIPSSDFFFSASLNTGLFSFWFLVSYMENLLPSPLVLLFVSKYTSSPLWNQMCVCVSVHATHTYMILIDYSVVFQAK